jgi:hypothetical protein
MATTAVGTGRPLATPLFKQETLTGWLLELVTATVLGATAMEEVATRPSLAEGVMLLSLVQEAMDLSVATAMEEVMLLSPAEEAILLSLVQ